MGPLPPAHQPAHLVEPARGVLVAPPVEVAQVLGKPQQQAQLVEVQVHPVQQPRPAALRVAITRIARRRPPRRLSGYTPLLRYRPRSRSTGNATSTATFDTYTAAKHLRDAGFDERQAEAAVSMVRDAIGADRGELATKADLAALEARLTWRLVGIAAAIVAAVKLIPGID